MGDCPSSSQRGGDHGSLDDLCVGCTCLARVTAVDINAIGALSRERNGDGNQLFVLYRDCSLGDRRLVKSPKGFHHLRREPVHSLEFGQIFFVIHKRARYEPNVDFVQLRTAMTSKYSAATSVVPGVPAMLLAV